MAFIYIDLTRVTEDSMPVYPGDEETRLYQTKNLKPDGFNNHRLEISMHTGTHIDGPMHLTESMEYISQLPPDRFIGRGRLIDVRNENIIKLKKEYADIVSEDDIVLLYTGFDVNYGKAEYFTRHPVLDINFAEFLVSKKVKLIGMDIPSPDQYPFKIHKFLLSNGVYMLENLVNLDKLLTIEEFEVIAFPLKIKADGSLVRTIARTPARD